MKMFALALMVSLFSLSAQAREIRSAETSVNIARVTKVVPLVTKAAVAVNVAVQDMGGSTDMSPTEAVYFTLYLKGEMFSTDATFEIAHTFGLKGAKRIKGGVYEITVVEWEDEKGLVDVTYVVDARQAIVDIKSVRCEDFDCDASENFSSTISVVRK